MSLPPDWPTILQDLTPIRIAAIAAPLLAYILWQPFPDPKKLVIHPSISDRSREETPLLKRFKEVVLICGLVTPAPVWSALLGYLVKDFRVLLYDHYGRGYSEAPEMEYTDVMYCTQVALLMQHVGWDKAHVVGVSMGGGIAVAFGAMFPKLVLGKVVLIAPAGLLKTHHLGRKGNMIGRPLVQYIASSSIVRRYLSRKPLTVGNSGAGEGAANFGNLASMAQLQQVLLPYHFSAVGSSIRDGPLRGQELAYTTIGANNDISILIFWGTADEVVPYNISFELMWRLPHAKLVTLEGGQHDISVTKADVIGPQIRDFLLP
ncbi:hypothetical protein FRB96_003754 [Tulasnella sp. 330]|nr:hypothetical protein FRB96_003754 [Tulasnella sp. 330]